MIETFCNSILLSPLCFFGYYPKFPVSWSVKWKNTILMDLLNWWRIGDLVIVRQTYQIPSINIWTLNYVLNVHLVISESICLCYFCDSSSVAYFFFSFSRIDSEKAKKIKHKFKICFLQCRKIEQKEEFCFVFGDLAVA